MISACPTTKTCSQKNVKYPNTDTWHIWVQLSLLIFMNIACLALVYVTVSTHHIMVRLSGSNRDKHTGEINNLTDKGELIINITFTCSYYIYFSLRETQLSLNAADQWHSTLWSFTITAASFESQKKQKQTKTPHLITDRV